jgi:hypothetical protein
MRATSGRDTIDEEVIRDCVSFGAEEHCVAWLRSKPRTLRQLRHDHKKWFTKLSVCTTILTVLEVLSTDEDANVRRTVAANANTPGFVLEKMATDLNEEVRRSVGNNTHSPAALLKKLATNRDSELRIAVARNDNTSTETGLCA